MSSIVERDLALASVLSNSGSWLSSGLLPFWCGDVTGIGTGGINKSSPDDYSIEGISDVWEIISRRGGANLIIWIWSCVRSGME